MALPSFTILRWAKALILDLWVLFLKIIWWGLGFMLFIFSFRSRACSFVATVSFWSYVLSSCTQGLVPNMKVLDKSFRWSEFHRKMAVLVRQSSCAKSPEFAVGSSDQRTAGLVESWDYGWLYWKARTQQNSPEFVAEEHARLSELCWGASPEEAGVAARAWELSAAKLLTSRDLGNKVRWGGSLRSSEVIKGAARALMRSPEQFAGLKLGEEALKIPNSTGSLLELGWECGRAQEKTDRRRWGRRLGLLWVWRKSSASFKMACIVESARGNNDCDFGHGQPVDRAMATTVRLYGRGNLHN